MSIILNIDRPSSAGPDRAAQPGAANQLPETNWPVLRLGFRPFYLLAASFAALAVPLWMGQWLGLLPAPRSMPAVYWHAHEMIFGFVLAVVSGFLLTAVRNWTGKPTPGGWQLAALAGLWLLARVLNYTGPMVWACFTDLAFVSLVGASLTRALLAAGNVRNYFVVWVFAGVFTAAGLFHAGMLGLAPAEVIAPMTAAHAGLLVMSLLAMVIAARIIPSFTANTLPGVRQWRHDHLDNWTLSVTGAGYLALLGNADGLLTAGVCLVAALLHALRLAGWNPLATRRHPMLWILHLSYAWFPVALVLFAASAIGVVPRSAGFHALAAGALSGLIVGMMTRTALGHTGRAIQAGQIEVAMFVLIPLAAILRIMPLLSPGLPYAPAMVTAAVCWSLAFALYLLKYTPYLTRARADGRPG